MRMRLPINIREIFRGREADAARRARVLTTLGWAFLLVGWGLVGLIVAGRGWRGADDRLRDNYRYMVRTVFIGLLYSGPALAAFWLTGDATLAILAVPVGLWYFARCVEGLAALVLDRPLGDSGTWLV